MDAVDFLKEWKRMCESCESCRQCAFYNLKRNICGCSPCAIKNFEIVVKKLNEWREESGIQLTEQQKTAIRGRIAEGYLWAVRYYENEKLVYFYTKSPLSEKEFVYATYKLNNLYDFVKTKPIYLPDLLGDEE